ncbi:MAG: hypothetical protein HOE11_01005 [Candidatus Diapherotrites archaeon]|nr:hypothetical protein [Candidatus Diapherotrites archaeon]MBT4596593.1 hypothetical protein [Candidatus Diapherotrites archaeon]
MPRGVSNAQYRKRLNAQFAFREKNMAAAKKQLTALRRKLTLKLAELGKKGIKSPETHSQARKLIKAIRDEQNWHDHNDQIHENMTLGLSGVSIQPASKEEEVLFKRGINGAILGPVEGRTDPSKLRKRKTR